MTDNTPLTEAQEERTKSSEYFDSIVTVRLNANEWEAFQKALAEPPKPNERLQRLMTEPSVFDETFASDDWRATMTINVARNEG